MISARDLGSGCFAHDSLGGREVTPAISNPTRSSTAKRKVELLLQLIEGEAKLVDACREHDLKQPEVESWMDIFLKGVRWLSPDGLK